MKKMNRIIVLSLFIVVLFTLSPITNASENSSNEKVVLSEIIVKIQENGTDAAIASKLAEKLVNGELLDCDNPNAEPVSISQYLIGNDMVTYSLYADGSSMTVSLSGGTSTIGSGYVNWTGRLAKAVSSSTTFQYNIDYTFLNGGNDYISRVYNKKIIVIYGSFSNDILSVIKSTENINGPAHGKLSAKLDYTIPPITGYGSLSVYVGNDNAYAVFNDFQ